MHSWMHYVLHLTFSVDSGCLDRNKKLLRHSSVICMPVVWDSFLVLWFFSYRQSLWVFAIIVIDSVHFSFCCTAVYLSSIFLCYGEWNVLWEHFFANVLQGYGWNRCLQRDDAWTSLETDYLLLLWEKQ